MKTAIIVHGWDGSPENKWLAWLKKELESRNFQVMVPAMPNSATPEINSWINYLESQIKTPGQDTYLIGHSIGCQAILRYLEKINKKVGRVILVAPWMHLDEKTIEEEGEEVKEIAKPWMETPINFNKIKTLSKFICIFSDNDYYVPLSDEKLFKKELNAETVIEHAQGHFSDGDSIEQIPIVLTKLLEMTK